jgi:flagellar basal-body rod modification protein FlgD
MVAVSATSSTGVANEKLGNSLQKLNGDFDSFLKLLTVQLQNQDPTEPLDTNQLTDQITQFSQVEQQINTNKSLQQLLAKQDNTAINGAVSYIDRFVEFEGKDFNRRADMNPIINYKLPSAADSVNVSITTESGRVLYSKDMASEGGTTANVAHSLNWDGKDKDGNVVAPGKYKVNVVAKDKLGEDIDAQVLVTDLVTEVAVEDGEITLSTGDIKFTADKVRSVKGLYADLTNNGTGTDSGS